MLNQSLFFIRVRKLWVAITHARCWPGLFLGVAPTVEHVSFLKSIDVDGVLDVGANRGQFSLACQLAQPEVSIVAFEPIPAEANVFKKIHGKSKNIVLIETALGEVNGTATLHLSQRADSSSLLPIGKKQTDLFSNTAEIALLEVPVSRMDEYSHRWENRRNQLLKIDVQGYELNVLRGALQSLNSCKYVYVECSEVSLYDGQALRSEVEEFLSACGFEPKGRFNEQFDGDQLIQADYLFQRS